MSYVQQTLMAGERIKYRATMHWSPFIAPAVILAFALLWLIVPGSRGLGKVVFVVAVVVALRALAIYKTTEFAVTNKRVIAKTGFLRTRSLETLLTKVEAISVDQPMMGRILGYGTIVVSGSGGTKEPFHRIADPLTFRRKVQELLPS